MILNVHQRILPCSQDQAAYLLDNLSGPEEALWPNGRWPRLKLDAGLAPGSQGGHGPIRYFVEDYQAGNSVTFRFTRPSGFHGVHAVHLRNHPQGCLLEHELRMTTSLWGWIQWQFVFRPLHDALIEDALDRASGQFPRNGYSPWVRLLRFLLG